MVRVGSYVADGLQEGGINDKRVCSAQWTASLSTTEKGTLV